MEVRVVAIENMTATTERRPPCYYAEPAQLKNATWRSRSREFGGYEPMHARLDTFGLAGRDGLTDVVRE